MKKIHSVTPVHGDIWAVMVDRENKSGAVFFRVVLWALVVGGSENVVRPLVITPDSPHPVIPDEDDYLGLTDDRSYTEGWEELAQGVYDAEAERELAKVDPVRAFVDVVSAPEFSHLVTVGEVMRDLLGIMRTHDPEETLGLARMHSDVEPAGTRRQLVRLWELDIVKPRPGGYGLTSLGKRVYAHVVEQYRHPSPAPAPAPAPIPSGPAVAGEGDIDVDDEGGDGSF